MTTFSQLVDDMILELKRPDLKREICTYANQTIRELHATPEMGNAILYRDNLRELLLVASVDVGFTWTIPKYHLFQAMAAVRFEVNGEYATERVPGRAMNDSLWYYYRASDYYVFHGYGGLNASISLAYYEFPAPLAYEPESCRPANFHPEFGWQYSDAWIETPELKEQARVLSTNWLLLRWGEILKEGIRAKVYKRVGDDQRARTAYSLYSQLRQGIFTSETTTQDSGY